ncbi:LysR family transcriptional regulator [Photobacterium sanguinicancri]|uniref:LysR family transcriptional regulator n=1 Tax=Photobacterium sanguinicancri TaxID=875932 RepID=A0AAW7Y6S2_9GAMM|nr:LysR family transcriptional regulator [Photobacterium sanguinicancri]MDO6498552.1 LysR family transcriptional regulator [Photobacterium sanguinicancri]MDO6542983.1 LysR family transcriptional regulator [Photobacterium sanguinicancri]OZS43099.1 LysR family transcriptional regulator [Photobacterium sanguinicancri]
MKISQVEMFLHASQTGSISEAARKLGKSRTTVSAALSALEDDLGVKLLTRTGNRILLTDIGQTVANDCVRLAMIANEIKTKCTQHIEGVESAIRIARDDALPESLWRDLIKQLKHTFPKTSLSVYVAPPPELENLVEQNIVDVAYGLLPANHRAPRLHHVDLGQIRMMSVAHKDHPLSQLRKVHSADLERYTEIALAYIDDESLKAVSPKSTNYIALAFYEYLRNAVVDGTGWSYVPDLLIKDRLRDGTVKVIKHNRAMSWQPYGEIVEQESRRGAVIQWLSDQLEDYLFDHSGAE